MNMGPGHVLAAVSYATDVTPASCRYHGWRVALLAHRLATVMYPSVARDVFYGGLLHDCGLVGISDPLNTNASGGRASKPELDVHPRRSAALLRWLPGMQRAADFVLSHHENWDGSGYPNKVDGASIPIGAQIIRVADAADSHGCFNMGARMPEGLLDLGVGSGHEWSMEAWGPLVDSATDPEFCRVLCNRADMVTAITEVIAEVGLPDELNNEEGIERAFLVCAALVDAKDSSTAGHSLRTAKYALQLAQLAEFSDAECRKLYYAGLAHDCGRFGLPNQLINTAHRLEDRELAQARKHANMTISSLSCMPECTDLVELANIAGHDHEWYDGTGYPDHLVGKAIPTLSRVLSIADAFDAMTIPRSYRMISGKATTHRLRQGVGHQFDPELVELMVEAINDGTIVSMSQEAA